AGLEDVLFEVMYAGSSGERPPRLDRALAALAELGGSPGHLADPRRNYDTDNVSATPAGISVAPPSDADRAFCEGGVTLFGIHLPGPKVDMSIPFADKALPPMARVTDSFLWERDPFAALRRHGDSERHQQYPGLDLLAPFWIARYHGLLPD